MARSLVGEVYIAYNWGVGGGSWLSGGDTNKSQVRFKESISDGEFQKAIEQVKSAGGEIVHEHTLFKGFTAKLPTDHVSTLSAHPELDGIEKDQEVSIQK